MGVVRLLRHLSSSQGMFDDAIGACSSSVVDGVCLAMRMSFVSGTQGSDASIQPKTMKATTWMVASETKWR